MTQPLTSRHSLATIGVLAALTGALAVVAGPLAASAGVVTALTWYALDVPYAIAAGHLVLAAASPGLDPAVLAGAEAGFIVFILVATGWIRRPLTDALVFLGTATLLAGGAWLLALTQSRWLAAGVLLTTLAVLAYGAHRYERVHLGLASAVDESPATRSDQ